jgi:hypothetical protein
MAILYWDKGNPAKALEMYRKSQTINNSLAFKSEYS